MNEQVKNNWVDVLERLPQSDVLVQVSYKTFTESTYCDRFAFCSPVGKWFYVNTTTGEIEDFPYKVYAWRELGEPFPYVEHLSVQLKEDVKRFKDDMVYKEIPKDDFFANTIFGGAEGLDGLEKIYVVKIVTGKDTDLLNRLYYNINGTDKQYYADDLRGKQIVMYCCGGDIENCTELVFSTFSYVKQQVITCLEKFNNNDDEMCDE